MLATDIAGLAGFVYLPIADQIGDVGYHPIFTGLDEPVVVEPGDVFLDHIDLFRDYPQQGLERLALFRVADAMDSGEQFVQPIYVRAHHDLR